MIIKQVQVGEDRVFCYILGCETTRQAVIIDPGGEEEIILQIVHELQLGPLYIINTHAHTDHTCGNAKLRSALKAKIVMHEEDNSLQQKKEASQEFKPRGLPSSPPADLLVQDGSILQFGNCELKVIHTPGHTPGGICLYSEGNLFTGDTLFVGAAGRVDLPGGDFHTLLSSLSEKIAKLPDETVIWPGHDYGDTLTSTIGREKKENPYLGGEW